jgi:hypothetical protein
MSVDPDFIYDLTIDQFYDLMDNLRNYEEQYGIIAKRVDEVRIREKSSKLTIDRNTAGDHAIEALKDISSTYEYAKKMRKI